MPELHKLSPSEVDLNLELFRGATKSGPQCPTTLEQVLAMPTQAHTSSIGPQAAIVDRWKHVQTPIESRHCTHRKKLEHSAKCDHIRVDWHLRPHFRVT